MNEDHERRRRQEEERRRREEEQQLTPYGGADLTENWQFKIVHGSFTTREKVEAVIREQAIYGWVLVEKFDNGRIRFKRPASEALNDSARSGDPYDTTSKAAGSCLIMAAAVILLGFAGAAMAR